MITQFSRGAGYVAEGFRLIRQAGIRRYVVMPLVINTAVFGGVIWLGIDQFDAFLDWLLPHWLDWARWLLWPLFALTTLVIAFYTFTLIAHLIGAPFNGLLAEKLEAQLGGNPAPSGDGGFNRWVVGSLGAILNEVRKLGYLAIWILPLLALFVIPGLNVLAPLAWAAFSAWMLALEYADVPMGNHELTFRAGREILAQNRAQALGFGGALLVMTMVPVLNFIVMPVGVAGATAMWVDSLSARALPGKPPPSSLTSKTRDLPLR